MNKMKGILTFLLLFISISSSFPQLNDQSNNSNSMIQNLTVSVTIGGDFPINGSFPAYINERVDQFITRMYMNIREKALQGINDPLIIQKINERLNRFVLRDITLKRATGEVLKLDLEKFRIDGDFKNNPYLKNDDVIIFPVVDMDRNFFTISGAVNKPGKYYYVEGDKLSDAIELAQGINKAYDNVTKAEIDRLSYNGQDMDSTIVDVKSDFNLQRGDRIILIADETQKRAFTVSVVGAVNRPGEIPITKDSTTISEVIEKSGGFRENASLINSRLFTANSFPYLLQSFYGVKEKENAELFNLESMDRVNFLLKYENALMLRMSNVDEEDSTYFILENSLRLLLESGPVNFTKVEDKNSKDANYIVKDGDVIIVPEKKNRVYVFGQVANPGFVDLVPGKNYEYYIKAAGGTGDYARNDVMVIKGSSKNWIDANDDVKIEDGDYIYVPRHITRSLNYYIKNISVYLSILASISTVILLALQFKK
jgi:protein involved in polysaccharide export with SLBB domain